MIMFSYFILFYCIHRSLRKLEKNLKAEDLEDLGGVQYGQDRTSGKSKQSVNRSERDNNTSGLSASNTSQRSKMTADSLNESSNELNSGNDTDSALWNYHESEESSEDQA